ncbi:MAG: hypothetical protein HZB53_07590 [Chloroflexi bacterium]|nr:hypothetical protein [Chloroflexota bacterium]
MPRVTVQAQIERRVLADAEKLVEAGHFAGLDEALEAALRALVLKYEQGPPALEARQLQALLSELDGPEREQFARFIEAYTPVAGHPPGDGDTLNLIALFRTFGARRMVEVLHEAQGSQIPLSPMYLETLLERRERTEAKHDEGRLPRARIDLSDPVMATVSKLHEREIGVVTESVAAHLRVLVQEYRDAEQWQEAFKIAASMNKRSLAYVVGVLKGRGTPKPEKKGKVTRGLSKSERDRETKRSRNKDYDDYWDAKLKARGGGKPGG